MLLAIDAGNTNTVFAVFDGERLCCQWRAATAANRTADEHAVWLTQLMALQSLSSRQIDGAIIATVVPQGLFNLRLLCRRYFQCEPLVVGEGLDLGIRVLMERPGDVGADRLVNAVAAHATYGNALVIIDFGTATTFDVVDEVGSYVGGVIAPGINLSLEALHRAAAQLPRIAVRRPDRVIGGGTVSAMQSGIYWGYIGLIEGLVSRIRGEFGRPMRTIATGGLAPLFASGTAVIEHLDADLTIRGLRDVYRRNVGPTA
ncbi:MAG: type III pantothenate kinase [Alphaproteobacteria bacterium]|nr:type III pantothenate kinase [Alphaproteobacteria bacterium]